ncbi:MAG: hypothetical protein PWP56_2066 [Acetobacterium sp.]|nr:hypothetical protein [Acetobacterium sp.]
MKNPIKNDSGSVLAYVLIFGMVILILVMGLLTVANSGISFTQQSVESRQAYMDAKSVIEYGKIEINGWQKELSVAYNNLIAVLNDEDSTAAQIQAAQDAITSLENRSYSIYGDENSVSTSLNLTGGDSQEMIGNVYLEKTQESVDATDTSNYVFIVETQNLRRKLDYQVSYDYEVTDSSGSSGSGSSVTTPTIPDKPDISGLLNPTATTSGWANTVITANAAYGGNWYVPKCFVNNVETGSTSNGTLQVDTHLSDVKENLFISHFDWNNAITKLNLAAKNICFSAPIPTINADYAVYTFTATGDGTVSNPTGQLRFQGGYTQNSHETVTMNAKYITLDSDLIMGSYANLTINCDNLYIKGDLNLNYPGGASSNLTINAKNVVVEGNLEVGSASSVTMNCPNVWIDGDVYMASTQAVIEFNKLNYLKAGDINLADDSKFSIAGADTNSSQVEVGEIARNQSISGNNDSYDLEFTNLWSFTCTELSLNYDSTLQIESNIVLINGNFTLGPQAGYNGTEPLLKDSLVIATQYFDCSGKTLIDDLKGDFLIKRIDYSKPLYVRFAGGYEQTASNSNKGVSIGEVKDKQDNNSEVVKNAEMIVFSGTIKIPDDNDKVILNLYANNIYFDSDDIQVEDNTNFYFSGESTATNDFTNFFIKDEITDTDKDIQDGSYYSVKGDFRWNRFGSNNIPDYIAPSFPDPPGTGGSYSTITSAPGSEKYY